MAITRTNIGNLWFNYRGDYDNSTSYKKDDVVIWNNTDYLMVRESSTTGKRPEQNTQYYYNVEVANDPLDSTNKFKIDADVTSTIEYAPILYVRRGDKIVFYQNNNNNDDNPLAISTTGVDVNTNYLTEGVSFYHNEEPVSRADYINTSKFNTKTARKVVVEFTKDTPDEIYYFSTGTANYGAKIVVADWDTWRPLRNSFKWRGLHVNTSGQIYYENDIVQIRVGINNDRGTDYEPYQVKETLSTYICLRQHTTDGTDRFLPYNRNVDTNGNMYWLKMGTEYEADDQIWEDNGLIETVNNISAADANRLHGTYRFVTAKSSSRAGAYPGMFKVIIEGDGNIKAVDNFAAANSSRTAGTYTNLSQSATTGVGAGARFNITIDSTGAASKVEIIKERNKASTPTGGSGYVDNEEITIADGSLGGGGAPDFSFRVNGVGVAGAATVTVEDTRYDSRRERRYFNDTGQLAGGEDNQVGDTITIDGDVFIKSGGTAASDLTFDVATLQKQLRGSSDLFTGNPHECVSLANRGPVFTDNKYERLGPERTFRGSLNVPGFIGGTGNAWLWGSNSTGGNAFNHDLMTGRQLTFHHYDWWRSTDNGGTGPHTTPDGEIPKIIQLELGYTCGMALMNSGELYHWGYGGHGQNGDASTNNRDHPVRVGGSNQNVYLAANSSTHVFKDVRIKRCWISNVMDGQNTDTHSCYALDENGNLYSWGYNGYGQLGTNNTTNYSTPQLIDKATYFNNNEIEHIWCSGGNYVMVHAVDTAGNLYAWGRNNDGQLGVGNTSDQNTPQQISSPAFTDSGVGRIKRLLQDTDSDDQRAAILTETGNIYTTGYNGSGWMGNGNTTALNTFTICSNGCGNAANSDAHNMWFTGCANYPNFWIEDSQGAIQCAGYNNYYNLGIGNNTTQNSFQTPKVQIGSNTQKDIRNVKQISSYSHYNDTSVRILTWDGIMYSAGRNTYGMAAVGFSSGNCNTDRDAENGKEHFNDGYFIQNKVPPSLMANVEDVNGCGYGDNSDSNYGFFEYKSFDNRYYINGYGGSYMQGQWDGQYVTIPHPPILG